MSNGPARRTRVCLITETYAPVIGGGETQARALAAGLTASGVDTRIVTRRSEARFAARERLDDVEITRLGPAGPGQLKKWAMLPRLLRHLRARASQDDVLLVCGYRVLGIAAVMAARRREIPVVLKADNQGEFSGDYFRAGAAKLGLDRWPWLMERIVAARNRLLRRADAFVALSSDMQAELESHGVSPEKILKIPNSVDTARFRRGTGDREAARRTLGLPEEGTVVIFTGRLLRTKGIMELVQAWRNILPDHPEARLMIVGGANGLMHSCEAELHAFLDGNGLRGSVMTTGYVSNVEDYLRAADIFAFPTQDEAFGISLIEAMAMGLAAVGTRVGGIKDIIRPEENGLMIDSGNIEQLETSLRRLMEDVELRERLGRAGAESVERRYRTETIVEAYAQLLERLARNAPAHDRSAFEPGNRALESDP